VVLGENVVLGGALVSREGNAVTITATCNDVRASPDPADRVYMAGTMEKCGKAAKCADGTKPVMCKAKQVCGPKSKFTQACSSAHTCSVNQCGGCSPVYADRSKQPTCVDTCPGGSPRTVCTANPCTGADTQGLPATVAFCLPDTCGGCKAKFYDIFGRAVEAAPSCDNR
jgi:hypothetical protein